MHGRENIKLQDVLVHGIIASAYSDMCALWLTFIIVLAFGIPSTIVIKDRIFYVQFRTESVWKLLCERVIVCCTTKRVQIALTLRIVACGTKLAWCPAGFIVFLRLLRKILFYLVDLRQELLFFFFESLRLLWSLSIEFDAVKLISCPN